MLPTQEMIDRLADRIERAFRLKRCNWRRGCSTPRIWSAAATILWQVHCENPEIPLDPELFVASQPIAASFGDPWASLAQAEAGQRYRHNVRRIIRRLRSELSREVRRAEDKLRQGHRLRALIRRHDLRISPLACTSPHCVLAERILLNGCGLLPSSSTITAPFIGPRASLSFQRRFTDCQGNLIPMPVSSQT